MSHEDRISELNEDRISELPSDILISIISRLTPKEATSTCILSTHWRHLHSYATHLNFPKFGDRIDTKSKYLSMIDHVLDSHRGTKIKELVVDLDYLECEKFEKWFEFALTKKAEKICLRGWNNNKVPILRLPITDGMKCLKDLYLGNGIKLTDQDFELLVSNCLALECLIIEVSFSLKNVSIVGHSKLKHVKLLYARRVESIVICDAISLVSLTLHNLSAGCAFKLSNSPKLTKLNYQENHNVLMLAELLVRIPSSIRNQLQRLRLSTTFHSYYVTPRDLVHQELLYVDLINIKHLELSIETADFLYCDGPFQRYVHRLIEACGSLETLVIKFTKEDLGINAHPMCEECRIMMLIDQPAPAECRNTNSQDLIIIEPAAAECMGCQHLKRIEAMGIMYQHAELPVKYLEITGYFGNSWQRQLAMFIVDNATALQKLSVLSCDQEALARARHDFRHTSFVHHDIRGLENKWCSDYLSWILDTGISS
ncbi:F-box/FBD/LRR-repeat protein At1g51370-like [Salvia hispanica]|uniref:F-box/FBD/LRR-repeat protein At1g51370-like n=1 Tax=Salvia hispanica TaxID=49212 RepID=UPI002009C700|nr:F-box/FBD/LRR-repeat protein At1g51370-like [Salvia hispanica]